MQNEISSGTMLGIVLIALAAVIGLGFGIFSVAKGVSNEGVVSVQDNLTSVADSSFEEYDNKIVTGIQVQSAYNTFQGKPVAILINTQAMINGVKSTVGHNGYALKIGEKNITYLNYNALLSSNTEGNPPINIGDLGVSVKDIGSKDVVLLKDTSYTVSNGFATDLSTGLILYDDYTGGFKKEGSSEYIAQSAKFESSLLRDTSNTIVGVIFTQLSK